MKRVTTIFPALLLLAGCTDYSGPSGVEDVYALARVGPHHLPVPLHDNEPFPLLLADTFRLGDRGAAKDQILRQTTVLLSGPGGQAGRSDTEFDYRIEGSALVYNNCPRGSLCAAAGLVYAPRVFQMVGDSLFEVTPLGSNLPPYVYGRVR